MPASRYANRPLFCMESVLDEHHRLVGFDLDGMDRRPLTPMVPG